MKSETPHAMSEATSHARSDVCWKCVPLSTRLPVSCYQTPQVRHAIRSFENDWISSLSPMREGDLQGGLRVRLLSPPDRPGRSRVERRGPTTFQWPPAEEAGGFSDLVKFRNVRVREL